MCVSFFKMEELVGPRHPHASHDLLLLPHHLPGPHSAYDDCEYKTDGAVQSPQTPPELPYREYVRKVTSNQC